MNQNLAKGIEVLEQHLSPKTTAIIIAERRNSKPGKSNLFYSVERSLILGFSETATTSVADLRAMCKDVPEIHFFYSSNVPEHEKKNHLCSGDGWYVYRLSITGGIPNHIAEVASVPQTFYAKVKPDYESTIIAERKDPKLVLVDYKDKSVALFGETKPIKDKLMGMGGHFNGALRFPGDSEDIRRAGFIFKKEKLETLKAEFGLV